MQVEHRRWQLGWHHSGRAWGHPTTFRLHIDFRDCENCESSYRIFQSTFNVLQLFKMFSVFQEIQWYKPHINHIQPNLNHIWTPTSPRSAQPFGWLRGCSGRCFLGCSGGGGRLERSRGWQQLVGRVVLLWHPSLRILIYIYRDIRNCMSAL